MKPLLTLLISIGCLQAQVGTFHAPTTATLMASGNTVLTIQQPATSAKQVTFIAAILQCPGQPFSVIQLYNGAGATTTAFTPTPMMTTSPNQTAVTTSFSASNVGAGTSLSNTLYYTTGAIAVIDLTNPGATMANNGITKNYSVTVTNTGSGVCIATLDVIWSER